MRHNPIAFIDSGVGGLPYLAHTRGLLPGEGYVYVADRANFPYGGKPRARIIDAVASLVEALIAREDPRLIVVACNTASVVALEALRARFPVPFVGVVPAVKPAAAASGERRFGVLATRRTVEGRYLSDLVRRFADGCTVVSLPAGGLVEFVEQDLLGASRAQRLARVAAEVERFRQAGIDTLVLGCTHFLHLEEEFRVLVGPEGIRIIDSRAGVTRQVERLLGAPTERAASAADPEPAAPAGSFYVTGLLPIEERYRLFAERFGLAFGGVLE
jgi:glutamate racemase